MRVLGIETSCDETAVSVVEGELNSPTPLRILSSVVASSAEVQAKYGGVIPEQAAREQVRAIISTLREALFSVTDKEKDKVVRYGEGIDAIAVTVGPGLVGSLLVGVETARTLACVWGKPIIPVNHLAAHLYANWIEVPQVAQVSREVGTSFRLSSEPSPFKPIAELPEFPALAVVISGGHSDMVLMKDHDKLKWVGGTRDDAAGECFDKCARLLGLPYPGGPGIARLADKFLTNKDSRFMIHEELNMFPRPLAGQDTFDWSFSGLKTAVRRETEKDKDKGRFERFAAEVQEAIVDSLIDKIMRAVEKIKPRSLLLAGGVTANKRLKEKLDSRFRNERETKLFIPPPTLCTDNGAYIAAYAFYHYFPIPWQKIKVEPGLTIMGEK